MECSYNKGVPEDVIGALDETTKLSWSSINRVIFHIADAPAHGKKSFYYNMFILKLNRNLKQCMQKNTLVNVFICECLIKENDLLMRN